MQAYVDFALFITPEQSLRNARADNGNIKSLHAGS